jgi:hypothetical protein
MLEAVFFMSNALEAYLHDHLAGSRFAIHLLESMRDQHSGDPLGAFAEDLLAEVEQDRNVLQSIADRVGDSAPVLKEAAAWVSEKVSRLKLSHPAAGELANFEALEAMSLGILGKRALWQALAVVAETDARVRGVDYKQLIQRAEGQHARIEERRLETARIAFIPTPT